MPQRFRAYWPDEDEWHWLELDDEGYATRHVVLRAGEPIVAACLDQVTELRDRGGLIGVQLYEAVYGALAEGVVQAPAGAIPIEADEFDRVFRAAVNQQDFARTTTGPFPYGSLVEGTFVSNPWPPGATGTLVDIGLGPVHGFVDAMWYFHNHVSWPDPGTTAQFRVVDLRLHSLQLRLEPTSAARTGLAWPQSYVWPKREFKASSGLRSLAREAVQNTAQVPISGRTRDPRLPVGSGAPGPFAPPQTRPERG